MARGLPSLVTPEKTRFAGTETVIRVCGQSSFLVMPAPLPAVDELGIRIR
jgi:hypothetical protein